MEEKFYVTIKAEVTVADGTDMSTNDISELLEDNLTLVSDSDRMIIDSYEVRDFT